MSCAVGIARSSAVSIQAEGSDAGDFGGIGRLGAWLTFSTVSGVIAGVAASAMHGAAWVDDTEPIEIL